MSAQTIGPGDDGPDEAEDTPEAKLTAFLLNLTQDKFTWLGKLSATVWTTAGAKKTAWDLFIDAARSSIRSSVAYHLVTAHLKSSKTDYVKADISKARYRAYEYWENLAKEPAPTDLPPLVLDPILLKLNPPKQDG